MLATGQALQRGACAQMACIRKEIAIDGGHGPYTHHNASAQVFPDGKGATRFVWVADLLPNELAMRTGEMMQQGTNVVKQTLEARAVRS